MNKLPSWRFWLPFFFQSALITIAPIQAIYTHISKEAPSPSSLQKSEVINKLLNESSQNSLTINKGR